MQLLFLVCIHFLACFYYLQIPSRNLLPALGEYVGHIRFNGYKQLSRKERRAMIGAVSIGVIYTIVILWATFSSWGILRSVNGGLIRSPFNRGHFVFAFFWYRTYGDGLWLCFRSLSYRWRCD